jgi:hypothetical protein
MNLVDFNSVKKASEAKADLPTVKMKRSHVDNEGFLLENHAFLDENGSVFCWNGAL